MTKNDIYHDIATRTGGSLFIGVLGPVRTGKSTFIKRFMETCVIPNIGNVYRRERAVDELPQSGNGRTIMTAEPKFVPEEAVEITLEDGATFSVRLIDSVGYMVKGAMGAFENGSLPGRAGWDTAGEQPDCDSPRLSGKGIWVSSSRQQAAKTEGNFCVSS